MSLDNPKGIESSVSKNTTPRRTFLKRATATTMVASLPLSSSWATGGGNGCAVSGNLSGNLSRECEPNQIIGKSPNYWKEPNNGGADLGLRWDDIFDKSPLFSGNSGDTLSTLLSAGGINAAIIAAYFNAENGFYGPLDVANGAIYANGLNNQIIENGGTVSVADMLAAIQSTYSI
ncbi:hypothetical protein L0668_06405 [Paraglaciecola aquimarina]|uniref:Uncharacterized protein n=1 Tax=Paraglaciecola algarum TaxID=3050085 RepID=A0ABS9D481_9ALTE|nr:hypothetical protein [Paraglaciecola sp. G1-23]MCF2947729.1 hypothetical protein [Paraglaciecola sp. G1-23]